VAAFPDEQLAVVHRVAHALIGCVHSYQKLLLGFQSRFRLIEKKTKPSLLRQARIGRYGDSVVAVAAGFSPE
jgi:hypothetical protein